MTREIDWRGQLESPGADTVDSTGFLLVSGWLLNIGSPVQSMTVYHNGREVPVIYGLSRPDVIRAHPTVVQAARSGFMATLPAPGEGSRTIEFQIWATLESGVRAQWLTRRVRVQR